MIQEKEVGIKGIPGLVITSGEKAKGVVLFYHGWSSQKEFQSVRGRILASYGYDVVIPDAVNHGCRGTLDYESKIVYPDFWQTIFQNMTEVPLMLEYIPENFRNVPAERSYIRKASLKTGRQKVLTSTLSSVGDNSLRLAAPTVFGTVSQPLIY